MIKDRKIKIAVVGCGRISKNHFDSIKELSSEFELVALCDNDSQKLAEHAERYNVQATLLLMSCLS